MKTKTEYRICIMCDDEVIDTHHVDTKPEARDLVSELIIDPDQTIEVERVTWKRIDGHMEIDTEEMITL